MNRSVLAAAVLAALCCAPVHAQTASTDKARNLDTVIVVGVQPTTPLSFETDPKLPRQPVPASDGADYLKTLPGFTAVRNGGTNGDPVLRGMFGSRLNLLSNGGAMHGACPSRMDNAMSYVAPETYDRLVVTKGPQTVLWGPGASAGTVRFERDRERFTERGVDVEGSLLAASFGRHDEVFDGRIGAPLGFVRFNGNRSQSGDYRDGDGRVVPSSWKKWNAEASVGFTPGAHTLIEAGFGRGDGEARYAGRGMDGAQFLRRSQSLRFEQRALPGVFDTLEVSLYRNEADHVMDNYTLRDPNRRSMMPMPMVSNVLRDTRGGRAALDWEAAAWKGSFGMDLQDSRHAQRGGMGRDAHLALPWNRDARMRNRGVFAETTWRVHPDMQLVGGLRNDRARVDDTRRTVRGGMGTMANPTFGQQRDASLSSGFIRLEGGTRALQWFAGIGHAERMPDYWELFSPQRGPSGAANAFAGIRPEKTTQLDVGLQYRGRDFDAWTNAYAGRIRDYILFDYAVGMMGMPQTRADNVRARIHGMESGVEWRGIPDWKLGGSVAWAWGANTTQHQALPQMPPLDARLHATWQRGRWSFGGMWRGAAKQSRVAIGKGNVTGRDLGASSGFGVFSLNGAWRMKDVATVSAGIDNVFDRGYSEHLNLSGSADFGYPADPVRIREPGRTAWVKLNLDY